MAVFVFLLGLCVGSFLNVLIDRLPAGESVFWTRSHCDYCHKPLRWFELIPVLSFILQTGHCARCHKKLSWQYSIVELATAIGFVGITSLVAMPWSNWSHWAYWVIFSSLLVIFVSDLKYQIIPDSMVVTGVIGTITHVLSQGLPLRGLQGEALWISVLAGVGSSLFFLILWFITRGRGMGLGDVKLAFLLGFLLGYPRIIVGLYAAFLTGASVGVILILSGKKTLKSTIAFGPFLIAGSIIGLLWGEQIIKWWRGMV